MPLYLLFQNVHRQAKYCTTNFKDAPILKYLLSKQVNIINIIMHVSFFYYYNASRTYRTF